MTTTSEDLDWLPLLRQLARGHQSQRQRLAVSTWLRAQRLFRQLDPNDLIRSFDTRIGRELTLTVTGGQLRAAQTATSYIRRAIEVQGIDPASGNGELVPEMLAGIASDGRPLTSLLAQPVLHAQAAIDAGTMNKQALEEAQRLLQRIIVTQVTDAGRGGDGVALAARTQVDYYVRMLNPPSCARCALLAGVKYRAEKAFLRHPHCDCIHVPIGDKRAAEKAVTDPREYFESLSPAEQKRIFGTGGAQAINDGADIYQVVNARRGMEVAGSRVTTNAEGRTVTRRGRVVSSGARPMPEALYQLASGRTEALALLRQYGYLR